MRFIRSVVLLCASVVVASTTSAQSNSSAVMLNVHLNGTQVALDNADTAETGAGIGFRLGWGITKKLTLFVGLDTSSIETGDPSINNGKYGLLEANIGGRYSFRVGQKAMPYLEFGLTTARLTAQVTGTDASGALVEGKAHTSGMGSMYGGGLSYYVARTLAIDLGLHFAGVAFDDLKVNEVRVHNSDVDAAISRISLGLVWYPIRD